MMDLPNTGLRIDQLSRWLVMTSLASYALMAVFTGPIRMAADMVRLTPLIYVPQLLMLITLPIVLCIEMLKRPSAWRMGTLMLVIFWLVVGMSHVPLVQALFGIYVLLPFWFGLVCGGVVFSEYRRIRRFAFFLWVAVVAGVLLNNVLDFPWEGYSYSVGEVEVTGSREWEDMGGGKRLAGFARASFDAGLQVLLLGLLVTQGQASALLRLLVWVLTVLTVTLTTSKGIYLVLLVVTPLLLTRFSVFSVAVRAMPLVLGLLCLALPMAPLLFDFHFHVNDEQLYRLTFSFWDRLNDMWPNAWKLLHDRGHPLWGRGLGGIGTPQTYFEPVRFNAADNLFLYWLVIGGWLTMPAIVLTLVKSLALDPLHNDLSATVYTFLLAALIYGMTANVVESGLFAMTWGLSLRAIYDPTSLGAGCARSP